MEAETHAKFDPMQTLACIERALDLGPLTKGQRPFTYTMDLPAATEVTAIFQFEEEILRGCTGECMAF